jgi:diguanylate cyclase
MQDAGSNMQQTIAYALISAKISPELAIFCRISEGELTVPNTMSANNSENQKLNLNTALRILENAGRPDPRLASDDPDIQIQGVIDALCDLSIHDGLTGLVNATFFHAVLTREIERSLRTGRTCGLIVIDIDYFKSINDTYGHSTGDKVIQAVAAELKRSLRSMDTAARIGGEEFAVILPECAPEDAIHAATRIHSVLNPMTISVEENSLKLTTSAGLVWTNPNASSSSAELLSEADQEMYRAKRSGRGRLCYRYDDSTLISHQERSALMALPMEGSVDGH